MDNTAIKELNMLALEEENKKEILFTSGDPIAERLWYIALDDVDRNYCIDTEYGRVFAAGGYNAHKNWDGLTFNRDTSYSGLLGLNLIRPKEMLTSMKAIRECRKKLGFCCIKNMALHGVPNVKVYDMPLVEFKKIFHKASSINKTDDVIWLWCAYDLLMKNDFHEWEWLYENGRECFERFYDCFFDEHDGLYFGQPTFIDVGSNGYPESFGYKTEEAMNNGVWVKASSTNSLYYKGLCIMAEAAEKLGKCEDADAWRKKAEALKAAVLNGLRFEDGRFAYFKHKCGKLEERQEILGSAFPVLCGIAEEDDAKAAIKNYPVTAFGAPLIYPYFENDLVLHNNSMWPFADTFLLLAVEKALDVDLTELNLQILKNDTVRGHMGEFRNARTNEMMGASAQLWSIAAYINTCVRAGMTELDKESVKIN